MKRTLLLSLLVASLFFTSCGSLGGGSLKTDSDSVSYAIGVDFGTNIRNFDSINRVNFDVDVFYQAVKDAFANKGNVKMTPQQSYEFLQVFMQKQEYKIFQEDSLTNAKESADYLAKIEKDGGYTKTETGLLYKITEAGKGANSEINDTLDVHYVLTLADEKQIESSYDRGTPMSFPNLPGRMVAGFTEGMTLLNKGAKATLVIPASLGYGSRRGQNQLGPERVLIFNVELVDIKKAKKAE